MFLLFKAIWVHSKGMKLHFYHKICKSLLTVVLINSHSRMINIVWRTVEHMSINRCRHLTLVWRRTPVTPATRLSCGFVSDFLVRRTRCAACQPRRVATGLTTSHACCGNKHCTTVTSDVLSCCVIPLTRDHPAWDHPASCHSVAPRACLVHAASTLKVSSLTVYHKTYLIHSFNPLTPTFAIWVQL